MPAPGDVGDTRAREHRLRPRHLRDRRGEVPAAESSRRWERSPGSTAWPPAASATWPGLSARAGVAAGAGPAEAVQAANTINVATGRCHGERRIERKRRSHLQRTVPTQSGLRMLLGHVSSTSRSWPGGWASTSSSSAGWWPSGASRS